MSTPEVSVVIPTHNRRTSLERTLGALSAQSFPLDRIEVIVVANGCLDDTVQMLHVYNAPYKMRYIDVPACGAALARNLGAEMATGRLLLFLDDDIEAGPELIGAHVRAHAGRSDLVTVGYMPVKVDGRCGFFQMGLRLWWESTFDRMRETGYLHDYRSLLSGNFSLTASLFRRVGGFDSTLTCREDYELGVRLLEADAQVMFLPEAWGYHHVVADVADSFIRARNEGRNDVLFGRTHEYLRPTLRLAAFSGQGRTPPYVALVFLWPLLGELLARAGQALLPTLERIRWRKTWNKVSGGLRSYWYWRGVADEIKSMSELRDFITGPPKSDSGDEPFILNLESGYAAAEERLDTAPRGRVRLMYGSHFVGEIEPGPGTEKLRGVHLRSLLRGEFLQQMVLAMALERGGTSSRLGPSAPHLRLANKARPSSEVASSRKRVGVAELRLPGPVTVPEGYEQYDDLRLLVRFDNQPIGWTNLSLDKGRSPGSAEIQQALGDQVGHALVERVLSSLLAGPRAGCQTHEPISVVVCTRERTDLLETCLQALLALDYPAYEVIVVDNAPTTSKTKALVSALPVRYIREDTPGLDWARNRGISEARYDVIAFTDDDTQVDPLWLQTLNEAFRDATVSAVTGLVVPLELDTSAQVYFEDVYGGMGKGFRRKRYDGSRMNNRDRLWASGVGVGANMAFRRKAFEEVGLFDVALDVGTPTRGGGDIEMFHRLLMRGHTIVYEPGALVWHRHRRDEAALRRQLSDNGCGFGSYLLTCAQRGPLKARSITRFFVSEWLIKWMLKRLIRPGRHARKMVLAEFFGMLGCRSALRRSRRENPQGAPPLLPRSHAGVTQAREDRTFSLGPPVTPDESMLSSAENTA